MRNLSLVLRSTALGGLALVSACGKSPVGELCAPPTAARALSSVAAAPEAAGPITVYWDGSESIAGYADGSTDSVRPLGDAYALLNTYAQRTSRPVSWLRFGEQIAPIAEPGLTSAAAFYRCAGCDKLESRIDTVLDRIAQRKGPGLDVVVSDFWLSNQSLRSSAEIGLGQPLREILRQGRSVGVIGLKAPYAGPVFDVPAVGVYQGARKRPLLIMLVGSRREVLVARQTLLGSGSPAFEDSQFTLFTREPAQPWLGAAPPMTTTPEVTRPRLISGDKAQALPQLRFSLEAMTKAKASVVVPVKTGARIIPNAVWRGALGGATRVWRHQPGASCAARWIEEPPLPPSAWRKAPGDAVKLVLDKDSTQRLVPGGDYLIQAELFSRNLSLRSPETAWLYAWSLAPDAAPSLVASRPDFFPTLNLAALTQQLEGGVRDTSPQGLPLAVTAMVVRVDP